MLSNYICLLSNATGQKHALKLRRLPSAASRLTSVSTPTLHLAADDKHGREVG